MELKEVIEKWEVGSEVEAEALVERTKSDPNKEGYEVTAYSITKKTKGEDTWCVVKITKKW